MFFLIHRGDIAHRFISEIITLVINLQTCINRTVYFRCVVWTGDGRVFFYNPSSRTSVWERPEDLVGRADVDKMVASPPDAPNTTQASTGNSNTSSVVTKRAGTSADSSDDDQPTPSKKSKDEQSVKGITLRYLHYLCTAQWLLYVLPGLKSSNSVFCCPHSVFMCFVWI